MVHNLDHRLATAANNSKGKVFHVGLNLQVGKLATISCFTLKTVFLKFVTAQFFAASVMRCLFSENVT